MDYPKRMTECLTGHFFGRCLLKPRTGLMLLMIGGVALAILTAPPLASGAGDTLADVSVTKSGDDSVPRGGQTVYNIVVTNGGPDDALNVVVSDPIPAHTTFVNASASQGSAVFDGTTVTGNFGTILPFESANVIITLSVDNDIPRGTTIHNVATATSDTPDPDPENNLAAADTVVTGPFTGDVVISEFRFRGPTLSGNRVSASSDEFVEIYNNTDAAILVTDPFGNGDRAGPFGGGWALVSSDNPTTPRFVIPSGTSIPARGHILAVNSDGYSLNGYPAGNNVNAVGDFSYSGDIPDSAGLALFRTANSSFFNAGNRFDAVGFSAVVDPLFREGNGLGVPVTTDVEHSFVRKMSGGPVQDTDNNLADFALVATNGNSTLPAAQLGAPGPENLFSPLERNGLIKANLIEPLSSSSLPPNRVREGSGDSGTLSLRRRFRNDTGGPITRLRFRVVNMTTQGTPIGVSSQADLRLVTSDDFVVATSLGDLTVRGTVLEEPPAQGAGGGLNTSAVVFLTGGALAPGAPVDLQFLLNVAKAGTFRFLVNVEALEEVAPPPEKPGSKRKQPAPPGKPRVSRLN